MAVASFIVLPQLISDKRDAAGQILFYGLSEAEKSEIRLHDLAVIRNPYVIIGLVVLAVFVIIAQKKMPKTENEEQKDAGNTHTARQTLSNLWHNVIYREGVIAQMFYVAAQIMTWTFIIQYADNLGINKATAQTYNIVAMSLFLCSRFISTFLMKYVNSRKLLTIFGCGAALCALGAILIVGKLGLYSLVGISFFMSLMFPTIYGIALQGLGDDAKFGAAGLIMAILGGSVLPPLQATIIDQHEMFGMPAVNVSFILPLFCFIIIIAYGYRTYQRTRQ
jgi:FHS family L-fucose permease-like MFS transporter